MRLLSTIFAAHGMLFLRTAKNLYCIGQSRAGGAR